MTLKTFAALRAVLAIAGRRGGKSRSKRKLAASRRNGKLGGRPKNQESKP